MSRTRVISASRTKDLVRWSPGVLADVLAGRRPCRFGRSGKPQSLDMSEVHTLVLWTKDPGPMVQHAALRQALEALIDSGGQVYLQLTATGFGGTFVEYGVPQAEVVRDRLAAVVDAGLLPAHAVKLRYDPLISLRVGDWRFTNMRRALFRSVLGAFVPLGVQDVVTSYVDFESYPKVRRRIEAGLGLTLDEIAESELREFVEWMAEACHARGVRFDTCASPRMPFAREGCISGSRLNALMAERRGADAPRCTTQLHNERAPGGQRADCRCTFSSDIGYSAGFTTCYTHGSGCLYCYSHHESLGPRLMPKVLREIAVFVRDPQTFVTLPGKEAYRGVIEP